MSNELNFAAMRCNTTVTRRLAPGLFGDWQTAGDDKHRRKMIANLVQMLHQRKPNAPAFGVKELLPMAKKLEVELYRSAKSFDEYIDSSTLEHRLQQQAASNTNTMSSELNVAAIGGNTTVTQQLVPGLIGDWQTDDDYKHRRKMIANLTQLLNQRKPHAPAFGVKKLPPIAKKVEVELYRSAKSFDEYIDSGTLEHRLQQLALKIGEKTNKKQEEQRQRLLLMRHAGNCQHQGGRCPVMLHCASMKRLWKHMNQCKNPNCQVPLCISDRDILSHYHGCNDVRCGVCGPIWCE
jgi:HPt (histidine-containing phosphotransfer) domain-containing protein